MEFDCSHDSYYECLTKRLAEMYHKPKALVPANQCMPEKPCGPFSLPLNQSEFPVCANETERLCSESLVHQLEKDQHLYCKKSCNVKEYTVKGYWHELQSHQFKFKCQFSLPTVSKELRSKKPVKTVKNQYLIVTAIALIGNVGGTLGLFVGYSFFTNFEWLVDGVLKLGVQIT